MVHGGYLERERLSNRIYNGLAKLGGAAARWAVQTNIRARDLRLGQRDAASPPASSAASACRSSPAATTTAHLRPVRSAGGTLGILIPPSFPMIIYGRSPKRPCRSCSSRLIPGLIMTVLFMIHRIQR